MAYHIAFVPAGVIRACTERRGRSSRVQQLSSSRRAAQRLLKLFDESMTTVRELLPQFDDAAMERNWRLTAGGTGNSGAAAQGISSRCDAESLVPASRPVQRLSARARRCGAGKLGTERGRAAALHAKTTGSRVTAAEVPHVPILPGNRGNHRGQRHRHRRRSGCDRQQFRKRKSAKEISARN